MSQGLEIQTLTKGQLQHLSNALSGDIREAFKAYIQRHYCPAFNDAIWDKKPTRGCRRFDFSQINHFAVLLRSFRPSIKDDDKTWEDYVKQCRELGKLVYHINSRFDIKKWNRSVR